jgi:hypothetical protein
MAYYRPGIYVSWFHRFVVLLDDRLVASAPTTKALKVNKKISAASVSNAIISSFIQIHPME